MQLSLFVRQLAQESEHLLQTYLPSSKYPSLQTQLVDFKLLYALYRQLKHYEFDYPLHE
jgi:hypothetical protein